MTAKNSANEKESPQCIFLLAGEASGDLYGGMLVKALLKENPRLKIIAWGGEKMEQAGAQVLRHYKSMAFMGFLEVVKNLGTIRTLFHECEQLLGTYKPDVFVGIDYPGFNLKMASKAKALGVTTHHYISPSLWAWNKRRVHTIRKHVDQMHVILPFEKKWFAQHDVDVNWVGHPLLELQKDEKRSDWIGETNGAILALIPGSRKQEIECMLPLFVEVARQLPHFTAIVAGAQGMDRSAYEVATNQGIEVQFGATRNLMRSADVGLITSGTATLEAALLDLPHIICYRTSKITYLVAKQLAQTSWIGLPNILTQQSVIPERIQKECTVHVLVQDVTEIHDGEKLLPAGHNQLKNLEQLKRKLETTGAASQKVAASILSYNPSRA